MSVTKTQQKKQEQDKMLLIIFILLISPTSVKLENKCVITSIKHRKIKHRIELCSNVDFKKHPRCVDQCSEGIFVDLIILT